MIIGKRHFDTDHQVYLMGILNVTPDSFSDGGRFDSLDRALFQAERMIAEGSDLLDIGGESTRPRHSEISVQEEIDRVAPVLAALRARFDIALSLDSYKPAVIAANLSQIDMVNDIWGLRREPDMAALIARSGLPCCLMHNRKTAQYVDFWGDLLEDMRESLRLAESAGIAREKIILDAGVGFAKDHKQNLLAINRTDELCALGQPVMLAISRKSVVGHVLDREVDQRLNGTLAATAIGVVRGASFLRVHDVKENWEVARMTKAIVGEGLWMPSK